MGDGDGKFKIVVGVYWEISEKSWSARQIFQGSSERESLKVDFHSRSVV